MRACIVAGIFVLSTLGLAHAQSADDFSGTWKLDSERSDMSPAGAGGGRMGGPGRGGRMGGGPRGGPLDATLRIRQDANELVIERDGGDPVVYRLDGSESTVPAFRGEMRVRARWEDGKLVTDGAQPMDTPRGTFEMKVRQVRWLEDEGRTMIVESTFDTPRGTNTRRLVYTKQES